ncbi:MAG TPA: hypothetical protein VGR78_02010 [Verrucomicrobiae bacterium]|jgi:hypothetical protein|nr:hypothetical protein [Verrucomicrobiae bacterium]
MQSSDRLSRHLIIAFVLAVGLYALFFSCDQKVRTRKGPWEVQFTTNAEGFAMIVVDQRTLQISNVQIVFLAEHASNFGIVAFDAPLKPIPFGQTKFEDLTYLPGSEAFNFFGHEVELLPRTLYLNKKEQPWVSGKAYLLHKDAKLRPEMSYDPRKKRRF